MHRKGFYILAFVLFVYLVFVCTFVTAKLRNVVCKEIEVNVKDASDKFVDEEEIKGIIKKGYGTIKGHLLVDINRDAIEHVLSNNPLIKSAEVYYSWDGISHVDIYQRRPLFRVQAGEGFYVDEEGIVMPLSRKYTSRVLLVTGAVSREYARKELFNFITFLKDDEFWNVYIEQIVINGSKEITLIPKVGNFKIILGSLNNASEKMEKLRLFLKKGIEKRGWNKYKEVNLKFDKQIVCVRRN